MENNLFSIIIPTWNNLPILKICIDSIRKNSTHKHQIIIYVNDGSDGTLSWVKEQKLDYLHSPQNIGICIAVNRCRTLVTTDYLMYMNDDMYACPGWDSAIWEEIQSVNDKYFYLSSTMMEPVDTNNPCVIVSKNYGTTPETFDENNLLKDFMNYPKKDWSGASWPPSIVHKELWDIIGGFSIEFSPGMYSDPDFSIKLYKAGVRIFKGISKSRVYHFGSKTTSKIKKNNGYKQFILKWGITAGTFYKKYLKLGTEYDGKLKDESIPSIEKFNSKTRFKLLGYVFKNS